MTGNPTKRCGRCHAQLPLSKFQSRTYHNRTGITLGVRSVCKACSHKRDAEYQKRPASQPKIEPEAKASRSCTRCEAMSWRVRGPRCQCGLLYADEPRPELELRRYREPNS